MGGSRNPRKIGIGMPNILGFVEWGLWKMGVTIFCDTSPPRSPALTGIINTNVQKVN